jgi:hypothetical protein
VPPQLKRGETRTVTSLNLRKLAIAIEVQRFLSRSAWQVAYLTTQLLQQRPPSSISHNTSLPRQRVMHVHGASTGCRIMKLEPQVLCSGFLDLCLASTLGGSSHASADASCGLASSTAPQTHARGSQPPYSHIIVLNWSLPACLVSLWGLGEMRGISRVSRALGTCLVLLSGSVLVLPVDATPY